MQLLPPLIRDPRAVVREASAGRHLPYGRHVDEATIETRDGLLMQFIQLRGLLFETADTDEINYRKRLRDTMLQAIGSSRLAIYHHAIRRRVEPDLAADFPDAFSRRLDAAWRARLATRQLYVNDLYLTLVRRPAAGGIGLIDRVRDIFARGPASGANAADRRELDAAREAMLAALGSYGPRLLTVYDSGRGLASEPLEFLARLYNGESQPVLLPMGDLGEHLAWRRVSFGQQTAELGPSGDSPRRLVGIVWIKGAVSLTRTGLHTTPGFGAAFQLARLRHAAIRCPPSGGSRCPTR